MGTGITVLVGMCILIVVTAIITMIIKAIGKSDDYVRLCNLACICLLVTTSCVLFASALKAIVEVTI